VREKPWLGTPRLSHPDGEGAPPTLLARKKPVVTPAFAAGIHKCSVTSKKPDGKSMRPVDAGT